MLHSLQFKPSQFYPLFYILYIFNLCSTFLQFYPSFFILHSSTLHSIFFIFVSIILFSSQFLFFIFIQIHPTFYILHNFYPSQLLKSIYILYISKLHSKLFKVFKLHLHPLYFYTAFYFLHRSTLKNYIFHSSHFRVLLFILQPSFMRQPSLQCLSQFLTFKILPFILLPFIVLYFILHTSYFLPSIQLYIFHSSNLPSTFFIVLPLVLYSSTLNNSNLFSEALNFLPFITHPLYFYPSQF